MTVQVWNLPDLGTTTAVTVISLSAKPGAIRKDQEMLVLESDKASMDVPAQADGVLVEFLIKVGDKVTTGSPYARIETGASTAQAIVVPEPVKESPIVEAAPVSVPAPVVLAPEQATISADGVHAGPATRRMARELGVDLRKIAQGTGRAGRIMTEDVQQYVKAIMTQGGTPQLGSGIAIDPMPQVDFSQFGTIEKVELHKIKKLTAKNLHRNWVTIPHVTQFDEADITELEAFRQSMKDEALARGVKLTPLAFIMKAVVGALKKHPEFNSSLSADGQSLILKQYFHIGVAVDTPNGLVVPVIRDVANKGIYDLAKELAVISEKARTVGLSVKDMQGGSFTISSLGGIGGTAFTPIINAPEVAILGVSKSAMKPVWNGMTFAPRLHLPLSLSYDHRVIDGAQAARFSATLCAQLADIRLLIL